MKNARMLLLFFCLLLAFSLLLACGDDDDDDNNDDGDQTPPPSDRIQCDDSCLEESETALDACVEILIACGAECQTEECGQQCLADLNICDQTALQNMLGCAWTCDSCLSSYSVCSADCDSDSSCLEACEGEVYTCNGWDQSCLSDCQADYHTCWDSIDTFESIRNCINTLDGCKSGCR